MTAPPLATAAPTSRSPARDRLARLAPCRSADLCRDAALTSRIPGTSAPQPTPRHGEERAATHNARLCPCAERTATRNTRLCPCTERTATSQRTLSHCTERTAELAVHSPRCTERTATRSAPFPVAASTLRSSQCTLSRCTERAADIAVHLSRCTERAVSLQRAGSPKSSGTATSQCTLSHGEEPRGARVHRLTIPIVTAATPQGASYQAAPASEDRLSPQLPTSGLIPGLSSVSPWRSVAPSWPAVPWPRPRGRPAAQAAARVRPRRWRNFLVCRDPHLRCRHCPIATGARR